MPFDPQLAEIRFGCGLSPNIAPPRSVSDMLQSLAAEDDIARRFPIETFETFQERIAAGQVLQKIRKKNRGSPEALTAKKGRRVLNKEARIAQIGWLGQHINRWVWTNAPLRERLTLFWADHFTATGKAGQIRRATSPYIESAIRPNINGTFEDLLIAAVLHPLMIHFLDQHRSIGANSVRASRGGKLVGLNENLAREVLELHTLGAGGPYTQTDVTQLAELLTGVTYGPTMALKFRKDQAEPGAETVLGTTYGGGAGHIRDVTAVLRDLAKHPATARHIAWKMAVHFTSDTPDPALITALEQRFLETNGDLAEVNKALLTHPAAWALPRNNVKPPFHFVGSAARALAVPPKAITDLTEKRARHLFVNPMSRMGHIWEKPDGPDGLPEEDSLWIAPQGIAARLQWAITIPQLLLDPLPDPRDFVTTALGNYASPAVTFAAKAAETRSDGVGLILASPAFQRT
ncbi:DUF1800 domain-containing protein [Sulfitobacter donghicola]|uniref:DUF1800 domain-containing protein n=1 Tax=Sulfitobacter donghicola DSW-25 = KCTC 12864 = JCM 14565 TaxID=1300350 RepID=A0A073IH05_9RHOB|nr:DUF1800 domain-containing protein [Sulfitobacter donghicola]KEJ89603.1 hypothetical protein DSW25_11465 [Sulfitobacter donghicola DSW-25 = KCTC 12864 = JCM 14565]KIN69441.1 DUF1800 domain containing protein [Sulfitobacter donghicola DSW-25 = KCTC 12864 = JCM 14565]